MLTVISRLACATLAAVWLAIGVRRPRGASDAVEVDRSPVDLVVTPDDAWLITVNQTSSTLSLVDIERGAVCRRIALRTASGQLGPRPRWPATRGDRHLVGHARPVRPLGGQIDARRRRSSLVFIPWASPSRPTAK